MKLKNLSPKITSIGKTMILPDEIGEVDDSWADNEGVLCLIRMEQLVVVEEAKPAVQEAPKAKRAYNKKKVEEVTEG